MTNENQQPQAADNKPAPFGSRLQSAREALGLDPKDAAAQLRLNEKIITMMEKDHYPTDLPATFIRGYIRAYAKLLQIPEPEVRKAIEPIKQKPNENPLPSMISSAPVATNSDNYLMQLFSYLILFTLLGLAVTWWFNRPPSNPDLQETAAPAPGESAVSAPLPTATVPATANTPPVATPKTQASAPMSTPSAPVQNAVPPKTSVAAPTDDHNLPAKQPGIASQTPAKTAADDYDNNASDDETANDTDSTSDSSATDNNNTDVTNDNNE